MHHKNKNKDNPSMQIKRNENSKHESCPSVFIIDFKQVFANQCFTFIPTENIRKSHVFWYFQGV